MNAAESASGRRDGAPPRSAVGADTPWHTQQLWQLLEPRLPGLSIEVVRETTSTNTALLDRLRQPDGPAHHAPRQSDLQPAVLVALAQTQGRGRLGRRWVSEPGASLTFSLAVPMQRQDWSGLSVAVGLALAQALDPAGAWLGVKWPNDLWLRDGSSRKLGGVLIEGVWLGSARAAVIGVGLNVRAPRGFAQAAGLDAHSDIAAAPDALAAVLPPLVDAVLAFDAQGFAPFAAAFTARDVLAGQPLTTTDPACPQGVGAGVAPDGALLVRQPDGQTLRLISGDVSVRPLSQK